MPVAPAPPAEPADVEALPGPDDADVAVDVDADVDVDTGMHSEHTTSRTTSITTYGRLDLGKSPPEAFVLVDGDSTFANGGMDDVTVARRQLGKGPALLGDLLSRDQHAAFVATLDDPDLATT